MAYFTDETTVYETVGSFLADVAATGGVGEGLRRSNTVVQINLTDPSATITLDLQETTTPRVDLGPSSLEPTVELVMTADTAHELFVGSRNLLASVQEGAVTFTGLAPRLLSAWPALIFAGAAYYRMRLEVAGRTDLLD
jgi:hypothetical protein